MTSASETTPKPTPKTPAAQEAEQAGQKPAETSKNATEMNSQDAEKPKEIGGRGGLDPARYGDWEVNGRCYDF